MKVKRKEYLIYLYWLSILKWHVSYYLECIDNTTNKVLSKWEYSNCYSVNIEMWNGRRRKCQHVCVCERKQRRSTVNKVDQL